MSAWIARFGTQFCSEITEQLNEILQIHHIRTTANGMTERAHKSFKASLGWRMRPDDNGICAFNRVTGEQQLVPHIMPPSFNLTQLAIQIH